MPLGGLPLHPSLKKTLAMRKIDLSLLALDGLTGKSYEGGIPSGDESDRISFCQVFRDLVMF